jgi:hypothetical protein
MFWLKDAPKLDLKNESTFEPVKSFIDQFITTDSSCPDVAPYLEYQLHSHGHSCRREVRSKQICRFGIPYPPMPQTEILLPLDENAPNLPEHRRNFEKIQSLLDFPFDRESVVTLSDFQNFLSHDQLNLSYEGYINAIRSSIKKPKVFWKRSFSAIKLNAYNKHLLLLQRANIDIQFILDPYACCSYVVNYINKSQRGISMLMREAINEIKDNNNVTIKQKLQHLGNKFIFGTEISAQEAVYCCLGMNLSDSSSASVYINTHVPEKRVRMLRSRQQLQNLPDDSREIFHLGLLDHYIQRPDALESLCLADFAAFYSYSKSERGTRQENSDEIDDDVPRVSESLVYALRDNSGFIRKRLTACIIRYRRFNINTETSDYFRELKMLYAPWRDEHLDLVTHDCELFCRQNQELVENNRKKYNVLDDR